MKIQEEVDGEESLEMARKERGEFVFSAFSSFLLAWPVRRLVMHDRCRYVYSVGCTRSGAKHRWKSPLASLRSPFPPSYISLLYQEDGSQASFHIRFQICRGSCTRNPENWTERSVPEPSPTNVLQMNDQLESRTTFFSVRDPQDKRYQNLKTEPASEPRFR